MNASEGPTEAGFLSTTFLTYLCLVIWGKEHSGRCQWAWYSTQGLTVKTG